MKRAFLLILPIFSLSSICLGQSSPEGFVHIKGGEFRLGRGAGQNGALVRIEDFEILDHPVT